MASEIKVDTISEKTSANGVTIDSVNLKDGKVATANSIDSDAYVDGSIDTAHIAANQVTGAKLNTDVISAQTALTAEPADTDEFLVSDAGTLKRIDYSLIKGGGITVADQWRLTSDFVGTNADISSNLEQVDTGGQGTLGSAMTESSGVFTFPSTGYWLVMCTGVFNVAAADNCSIGIFVTTDNSSYTQVAHCGCSNKGSAGSSAETNTQSTLIDVTSTSNVKVKFTTASMAGASQINGSTSINNTTFTFIRLGDT